MKFLLLLLVVIGAVAWLAIGRRKPPASGSRPDDAPPPKPAARPGPATPQTMVACAHCGVHLPAADALRDAEGRVYCSDAHRRAGTRSAG
jgi:uncharacterized protein